MRGKTKIRANAQTPKTMSSYAKVGGGALRLKGIGALGGAGKPRPSGAGAPSATIGAKRQREEEPSSSSSSSTPSGPVRIDGEGKIVTSGTTVHGVGTAFKRQLVAGDALAVFRGEAPTTTTSDADLEIRVVKFALSDKSASISAPFEPDLSPATSYFILKLPRERPDPSSLSEDAEAKRAREASEATGKPLMSAAAAAAAAAAGRAAPKGGLAGGAAAEVTREYMLDMRLQKKSDKYC
jgi:hypothetical protein